MNSYLTENTIWRNFRASGFCLYSSASCSLVLPDANGFHATSYRVQCVVFYDAQTHRKRSHFSSPFPPQINVMYGMQYSNWGFVKCTQIYLYEISRRVTDRVKCQNNKVNTGMSTSEASPKWIHDSRKAEYNKQWGLTFLCKCYIPILTILTF